MKAFIIVLLFIVMTIVIIGAVFAGMYNRLVKARISCEEAFSTMDVYMKKRSDLIPNLVEAVKSYTAYEAGTLEKVIAARNAGASALTMGRDAKRRTADFRRASSDFCSGRRVSGFESK